MTLPESYANNPTANLVGDIDDSATALAVSSSTEFPAEGQFRALIDSELMIVTLVSGTDWTVIRGAEGTTAASHTNGAQVSSPLTADSLVRSSNRVDPAGTRSHGPAKSSNQEGTSFGKGTTKTLLNYSGTPGCIRSFALNISSSSATVRELSYINVYIDGETTPTIDAQDVASMHCADNGPASFSTRLMGFKAPVSGDNNVGYYNYFTIPWTTSIKIEIVNPTDISSGEDGTIWWNTVYSTGKTIDWGRKQRFHTNTVRNSSVAPYDVVELVNTTGRGVFYGLYLRCSNTTDFHFLEGNIEIYVDGEVSPSIFWTGTEDYFLNSNYFGAGVLVSEQVGTVLKTSATPYDVGTFRFHLDDPIEFETSLVVKWTCGDAAENGGVTGDCDLTATAFWYTDQ